MTDSGLYLVVLDDDGGVEGVLTGPVPADTIFDERDRVQEAVGRDLGIAMLSSTVAREGAV